MLPPHLNLGKFYLFLSLSSLLGCHHLESESTKSYLSVNDQASLEGLGHVLLLPWAM